MKIFQIIPNIPPVQAREVKELTDEIKGVAESMVAFAKYYDDPKPAGIAATQLAEIIEEGKSKRVPHRICVVKIPDTEEWIIAINPKILRKYGKPKTLKEGCLTYKDRVVLAKRWPLIDIEFKTIADFEMRTVTQLHNIDGFQAQVWQHEIDHLDGVQEMTFTKDEFKKRFEGPIGTIRRQGKKIKPNAKCPCGSGRKFKHCCMNK